MRYDRVYNFSAGPAMMPESVLEEIAAEVLNYHGSGMSVMEMSHRSPVFQEILSQSEADLRTLMHIPDNYKVLFVQGGGTVQFAMVPMNLMKNGVACYVETGAWSKKAIAEADAKMGKKERKGDFITHYCYSDEERQKAIKALGPDPEITRFKGLGEISPDEFVHFIGPDMRLEQVTLHKTDQVQKLLAYYMGKNTPERQNFIIDNLVVEEDLPEEDKENRDDD